MTTNEPDNAAARDPEGADPEHSAPEGAQQGQSPPDPVQPAKGHDRAAAYRAAGGIPTGAVSTRDLQDLARRRREAEEKLQQHLEEAKHKPAHHHDGEHHDGGSRDVGHQQTDKPGGEPGRG